MKKAIILFVLLLTHLTLANHPPEPSDNPNQEIEPIEPQIPDWFTQIQNREFTPLVTIKRKGKQIYICALGQAKVNPNSPAYTHRPYTIQAATIAAKTNLKCFLNLPQVKGFVIESQKFDGQIAEVWGKIPLKYNSTKRKINLGFLEYNGGEIAPLVIAKEIEGRVYIYAIGEAEIDPNEKVTDTDGRPISPLFPAIKRADKEAYLNLLLYLKVKDLKNYELDTDPLIDGKRVWVLGKHPW